MSRYLFLNFFLQATTAAVAPYTQIIFRNKGYSHSLIGVIVALGQVSSIIIPLLICMLADRTRKTRIIAALLSLSSALLLIPSALSESVFLSSVSFFLMSGFFWTLNPMMDGYQNRLFGGDSSRYGAVRSFGTFGYLVFLILFAVSGFPRETDNRSILISTSAVFLFFQLALVFSPGDLPRNDTDRADRSFFSFRWFSRKFYIMMLIAGISRIAESVVEKLLSSYMTEILGVGRFFTLFIALGAMSEILMMMFGGRLLQKGRVSAYSMVMMSALGLVVRLLSYYFFPGIYTFALAQLLHSLSFGAFHIGMSKFIADNVQQEHYSVAMSFYWAIATNFPEMIGVLLGGFVIDSLGYPMLFLSYSVFPILSLFLGCLVFRKILAD